MGATEWGQQNERARGAIAEGELTRLLLAVPTLPDIQRYCDTIAEAFKPQRIVLFGSYAYGNPTPDWNVDVLVVMKKPRRFWMRATQNINERVSAGFPIDMIVRDRDFLSDRLSEGDTFLKEITSKGRVMYESSHA